MEAVTGFISKNRIRYNYHGTVTTLRVSRSRKSVETSYLTKTTSKLIFDLLVFGIMVLCLKSPTMAFKACNPFWEVIYQISTRTFPENSVELKYSSLDVVGVQERTYLAQPNRRLLPRGCFFHFPWIIEIRFRLTWMGHTKTNLYSVTNFWRQCFEFLDRTLCITHLLHLLTTSFHLGPL